MILRNLIFGIFFMAIIFTSAMADTQIQEKNRKICAVICQPCDPIPTVKITKKAPLKQPLTPAPSTINNNVFIYCDQSKTPCFDCFTSMPISQVSKINQVPNVLPTPNYVSIKSFDWKAFVTKLDWVTLITKLVSALAWPLTILIVIYFLRKPLKELIPKLLKLKYKDLELSFEKELKEAIEIADATALPKVDDLVEDSPIAEKRNRLFVLARDYPRAAILEAWLELEASIGNALYAQNIATKNERTTGVLSYKNSAKILFEDTPQYMSYFNSLFDLRNKAVHSGEDEFEIDHKKAVSFIELALRLVAYIESQWPKPKNIYQKPKPSEVNHDEATNLVKLKRLQLLDRGKEYYLDYLRNLTPQILLLTTIWLAGANLSFHFDISNFWPTLAFLILVISFLLAVYANWSHLDNRCFAELKAWESQQRQLLTDKGVKGCHRPIAMIKAILRCKSIEYFEYIILMFVVQITLAIVIGMSVNSATSIWKQNHRANPVADHSGDIMGAEHNRDASPNLNK